MDNQFKPGEVVILKSGSVDMTVVKVDGDTVSVLYQENGVDQERTYPSVALRRRPSSFILVGTYQPNPARGY